MFHFVSQSDDFCFIVRKTSSIHERAYRPATVKPRSLPFFIFRILKILKIKFATSAL